MLFVRTKETIVLIDCSFLEKFSVIDLNTDQTLGKAKLYKFAINSKGSVESARSRIQGNKMAVLRRWPLASICCRKVRNCIDSPHIHTFFMNLTVVPILCLLNELQILLLILLLAFTSHLRVLASSF